jgi:CRP/FNR family cyclic AMP-dependent transcriptional regulator
MSAVDTAKRVALLQRTPLFEGLDPTQLEELAAETRTHSHKRKEELFHKGDDGSDVYIVISGRLKALTTSADGSDVVFSILGPGDVIGEIAMLSGMPRTATVVALEACDLLSLSRPDILSFLNRHPAAAIKMLRIVSKRLANVSEFIEDALFLNLPSHLAKKLVDLAHTFGEETDAGLRLNLRLSQTELGNLVGATRESVNKQISSWRVKGIVSVDGGHIVIHRLDELEKLANEVLY